MIADLADHFVRLAPRDLYRHTMEGPDDMPAHIRTVLSGVQLSIPIVNGEAALGRWQGIYVFEHRDRPHTRSVVLHAADSGRRRSRFRTDGDHRSEVMSITIQG